jgi:hypothetical protein
MKKKTVTGGIIFTVACMLFFAVPPLSVFHGIISGFLRVSCSVIFAFSIMWFCAPMLFETLNGFITGRNVNYTPHVQLGFTLLLVFFTGLLVAMMWI